MEGIEVYILRFEIFYFIGLFSGREPTQTESQIKALNKLAPKLQVKDSSKKSSQLDDDDDVVEEDIEFNILDKPRTLLYDGKIRKKCKDFQAIALTWYKMPPKTYL